MTLRKIGYLYSAAIFFILIFIKTATASGDDLIGLADRYNKNGEYYNAVTELMRYQYLYPGGAGYPLSMLMMGEAYYRGGNYQKSVSSLKDCHERYGNTPEGEKAMYGTGFVSLALGSPQFAYRAYREYQYIYKDGLFTEDVERDMCYTMALMRDLKGAGDAALAYENDYENSKYLAEIKNFRILINEEINRPKKNVWISVLGSVIIPGFGHFYTGKYGLGVLSLATNALFGYLFYDGYVDRSKPRMIVFGLAGFSFYQYSLYSSITDVYEYNNHEGFYKSLKLSAAKEF